MTPVPIQPIFVFPGAISSAISVIPFENSQSQAVWWSESNPAARARPSLVLSAIDRGRYNHFPIRVPHYIEKI